VPISNLQLAILLIDVIIISYAIYNTIRILLFFVHALVLIGFVMRSYSRLLKAQANQLITAIRTGRSPPYRLVPLMQLFLREHTRSVVHAISANKYMISDISLVASISNFPYNIFLISGLSYMTNLPSETLIGVWAALLLQVFFLFTFDLTMFALTNAIHEWAPTLQHAILYLPCSTYGQLNLKLRLMSYYERLHTEDKICPTIGFLGNISPKALLEVRLQNCRILRFFLNSNPNLVHLNVRCITAVCVYNDQR